MDVNRRVFVLCLVLFILLSLSLLTTAQDKGELAILTFDPSGDLLAEVKIYLNGELVEETPPEGYITFEVEPGEYRIEVEKSGYETVTKSVQLESGELQQLRIELRKDQYEKTTGNEKPKKPEEKTQRKVLFDEGHDESVTTGNSQILVKDLENRGFVVKGNKPMIIDREMLTDCDAYIIGNAWSDFDNSELDKIKNYYKNGGGILLVGLGWSWVDDHTGEKYPMNEIAKMFGASFNEDIIMDPTNHTNTKSSAIFHSPFITSHQVTRNVSKLGAEKIFHGSIKTTDSWNVLIMGDNDSYGGYRKSPYSKGSNPPVLAVRKDPGSEGKVAIFSLGGCFRDDHIHEFDNKQLALNLIEWLAN